MRSLLHNVTEQPTIHGESVRLIFVGEDGTMMVRDVCHGVDIEKRCAKIAEDGGPKFTEYFYYDDLAKAVISEEEK